MKKSSRFSRLLGSRHLLQFKLSFKDLEKDDNPLLYKRFVLLGRVFMCLCAKDKKIYAIEVNEDYQRLAQDAQGDHFRMSFEEFLDMQNPLNLNKRKVSAASPPLNAPELTQSRPADVDRPSVNGSLGSTLAFPLRSRRFNSLRITSSI